MTNVNNEKCFSEGKFIVVPDTDYITNYKEDLIQKMDLPNFLKGKLKLNVGSIEFNSFENNSLLILNFPGDLFPKLYSFSKAILLKQPINIRSSWNEKDLELLLIFERTDNIIPDGNNFATFSIPIKVFDISKTNQFKNKSCEAYNYSNDDFCSILTSDIKRLLNKKLFDKNLYDLGNFYKRQQNLDSMKKEYSIDLKKLIDYLGTNVTTYDLDNTGLTQVCKNKNKDGSTTTVNFANNMLVMDKYLEISNCLYENLIKQFEDNEVMLDSQFRKIRKYSNNSASTNSFIGTKPNKRIKNNIHKNRKTKAIKKFDIDNSNKNADGDIEITEELEEKEEDIRKNIFVVDENKAYQNFLSVNLNNQSELNSNLDSFGKIDSFKNFKKNLKINIQKGQDYYGYIPSNSHNKHNHKVPKGHPIKFNVEKLLSNFIQEIIRMNKERNKININEIGKKCKKTVYNTINQYQDKGIIT